MVVLSTVTNSLVSWKGIVILNLFNLLPPADNILTIRNIVLLEVQEKSPSGEL